MCGVNSMLSYVLLGLFFFFSFLPVRTEVTGEGGYGVYIIERHRHRHGISNPEEHRPSWLLA